MKPILSNVLLCESLDLGDRCVKPPRTRGIETVPVFLGDWHASLNLTRPAALAEYERTWPLVGYAAVMDGPEGMLLLRLRQRKWWAWRQHRQVRTANLSPDWRRDDEGRLSLLAILAYHTPPVGPMWTRVDPDGGV